jgi:hypothetical protein
MQTLPFLSKYYPIDGSALSIDPLGTYTIADRLALRLVPGVRERMSHPRFLTLIAVGNVVCSAFDNDMLAKDDLSSPWQIYEWYVTAALVKYFQGNEQIMGLPGNDKVSRALTTEGSIYAGNYLKTPGTFGFHGVYRTLSMELGIIMNNNILGNFGEALIIAWEKEQGLDGFINRSNKGGTFRKQLEKIVGDGLSRGSISITSPFFKEVAEVFKPKSPGQEESNLIYNAFCQGSCRPYFMLQSTIHC